MPSVRSSSIAVLAVSSALISAGCSNGAVRKEASKASPPAPPVTAPWTPPATTLPKDFVENVVFLHANGLPDTRGCEFAEAKVNLTSFWSWSSSESSGPQKVKGWLLPGGEEIILKNGLRVPVVEVVGPCPESYEAPEDYVEDVFGTLPGLEAALLLIKGSTKQAVATFKEAKNKVTFERLGENFLAAKFERAVTSHMYGDDATAYAEALDLQRIMPAYKKRAAKMLSDEEAKQRSMDEDKVPDKESLVFSFLDPVDDLVRDSERRLNQKKASLDPSLIKDQKLRIAALITALEEVDERQSGEPGRVYLASDKRVKALVNEGEPALDALFQTMKSDKRLTRSVYCWRTFRPSRSLIGVDVAAAWAVEGILGVESIVCKDWDDFVDELAALAKKTKGMSLPQRWMRELEDDSASKQRWLEAAQNLLVSGQETSAYWDWLDWRRAGASRIGFKADELRNEYSPSLSETLARRSLELTSMKQPEYDDLEASMKLALMLNEWDPKASLPPLQAVTRAAMKQPYLEQEATSALALAILARHGLGDNSGLTEWMSFLQKAELGFDISEIRCLAPLYELKGEPRIDAFVKEMFQSKRSRWNLGRLVRKDPRAFEIIAVSRLIDFESVRESLDALLQDKRVIGEATLADRSLTVEIGEFNMGCGPRGHAEVPKGPLPNCRQKMRAADFAAFSLGGMTGLPEFALYWSESERDAALPKIRKFVREITDSSYVLPYWATD